MTKSIMTDKDIELKIKVLEELIQGKQKFLEDNRWNLTALQQREILNVIMKAREQIRKLKELLEDE